MKKVYCVFNITRIWYVDIFILKIIRYVTLWYISIEKCTIIKNVINIW